MLQDPNLPLPTVQRWRSALQVLWAFARPHTVIGTSLSVLTLAVLALAAGTGPDWGDLGIQGAIALLACLAGNVYIVGLNQLSDVEIDRINKPDLPLVAGTLSMARGQQIVAAAAALALVGSLVAAQTTRSPWLLAVVASSLAIGTAYSLPPLRLKRFPVLAALCILGVRGVIVNLGLFAHFAAVAGGVTWAGPGESTHWPANVLLLTAVVLVFSIAIALLKDLPDAEGDRRYAIATFTLRWGASNVLAVALGLLGVVYGGAIAGALLALSPPHSLVLAMGHAILWALLWGRSQGVALDERGSITAFYQFIWRLFFAEYLLFALASLVSL